jgi:hypothetical protein
MHTDLDVHVRAITHESSTYSFVKSTASERANILDRQGRDSVPEVQASEVWKRCRGGKWEA